MWEIREINNNNEIVQLSKLLENLKSQILSKNIDQNQQWDLNNIKDAINDLEKNITPQNVLSELKDKIKTPEISQEIAKIERVIQQKENTEKNQEVDLVQKDLTKLRKKIHLDTEIENMNESEITKLANHAFWKRLIPNSIFSKIIRQSSRTFTAHVFFEMLKMCVLQDLKISKKNVF